MLNRIILIGRLTADPEARYTPSGIPVTTFRIAVDRPISAEARSQGQEKQADFIDIVAWRQNAEFAANYLQKGRLVAVEGKLQIREYMTQDNQRRKAAEVVADNLKGLDRAPERGEMHEDTGGDDYEAAPQARAEAPARGGGGGYEQRSSGGKSAGGGYSSGNSGAPARGGKNAASSRAADPFDDNFDDNLSDPFAE